MEHRVNPFLQEGDLLWLEWLSLLRHDLVIFGGRLTRSQNQTGVDILQIKHRRTTVPTLEHGIMGVELEIALLLANAMAEHAVGFENRAV